MDSSQHDSGHNCIRLHVFTVLLAVAFFGFDLVTPLGLAGGIPYVAVVLMAINMPERKWIVIFALACSILTLLGFILSPPGEETWRVMANRFLTLFAIWVAAILLLDRKKADLEQKALLTSLQKAMAEIKTLSGLLPICAHCKKIRDDQGYWSQLEVYIRDHSNADFSHCICPACLRKHYPKYYKNTHAQKQKKNDGKEQEASDSEPRQHER